MKYIYINKLFLVIFFFLQNVVVYSQDSASLKGVIDYCTNQLKYTPSISIFETRADAKYLLGDYSGALADYKEISKTKVTSNIYYKIGLVLYYLKQYNQSEVYLNKSTALDKNNMDAYFARGSLNEANNKFEAAIKDYTKAIGINPNNALAFNNRGYVYQILNLDSIAIKDFTASINIDSTSTNAYYNRGYSKYKIGDFNGAIKDVNKSLEIYPESIYSIKYLLLIYKKIGDKEKLCYVVKKYKKILINANLEEEYKKDCN